MYIRKEESQFMRHENLFTRLDYIIKEVARLDRENPTGPGEETDPRIVELLNEGMKIQKELDPLMRGTFRNNPAKLAEWESIMQTYHELNSEERGQSDR